MLLIVESDKGGESECCVQGEIEFSLVVYGSKASPIWLPKQNLHIPFIRFRPKRTLFLVDLRQRAGGRGITVFFSIDGVCVAVVVRATACEWRLPSYEIETDILS